MGPNPVSLQEKGKGRHMGTMLKIASDHQKPEIPAPPSCDKQNISGHCQLSPRVKTSPIKND